MSDIMDADTVSEPQTSWRDHLKIHPAADLFPLMSESELRELGEDIKANGLRSPIVLTDDMLLDGRNRLDAMELVGLKFEFQRHTEGRFATNKICVLAIEGSREPQVGSGIYRGLRWIEPEEDGYDYVISANLHRRHLTSEQKRDLIARVLKAKPGASNRQIAKQVKAHHTTVGTVRAEMESTGEISQLEKTVGRDGKARPKTKKTKRDRQWEAAKAADIAADAETRVTGGAEVDVEQHRARMATLDTPSTDQPDTTESAQALAEFVAACRTWLPKIATVDEWTEAVLEVAEAKERWVKRAMAARNPDKQKKRGGA
jgi:hypothetical protein